MRNAMRISCLSAMACLARCGPRVGDVITIKKHAWVMLNRSAFDGYAELKAAGVDPWSRFVMGNRGGYTFVDEGSKVRVVAHVPSGFKIAIERMTVEDYEAGGKAGRKITTELPDSAGEVGYIYSGDL
jgi:hypothetical protein